jgi:DNA-binding MarR family transcriptional regulator
LSALGSILLLAAILGAALLAIETMRGEFTAPSPVPLTRLETDILLGLTDGHIHTIPELSDACGADKASVARALRLLGDRGLVEVRAGCHVATEAGRRAVG